MCDPKVTSVTLYPLKCSPGTAGGCPDSLGMEQIERMNVTCVIKKRKKIMQFRSSRSRRHFENLLCDGLLKLFAAHWID